MPLPSPPQPVEIPVRTTRHSEFVDITAQVRNALPAGFSGACHLFCKHTTAALTVNEGADPDVLHDLGLELERLVPWRNPHFRHGEGNSAAHLKSSLVGVSLLLPAAEGNLVLGNWQAVYFCEFDGPRSRTVFAHWLGATGGTIS